MILIGAGVVILIIVFSIIGIHNSLISKRNMVENAFSGMDVQLKKRYDLIPNIVASVKEYTKHEKGLLEELTELRTKAITGSLSADEKVNLDNQISGKLNGVMVSVENYPDLKASENFINLQRTLNEVESQISAARRAYNSAVTDFNTSIEVFPNSIIAGSMKLKRKEVFVITEVERQNVNVSAMF